MAVEKFSVRGPNPKPFLFQDHPRRLESTLFCSGSTVTRLLPSLHRSLHSVPGCCNPCSLLGSGLRCHRGKYQLRVPVTPPSSSALVSTPSTEM